MMSIYKACWWRWDVRAKHVAINFRCRRALPCITVKWKLFPLCLTLLIATDITGLPKVAWFSRPGTTWTPRNKITFPFLETRHQAEASISTRITAVVKEMLDGSWRHLGITVPSSPAIPKQSSCTVNLLLALTGMITVSVTLFYSHLWHILKSLLPLSRPRVFNKTYPVVLFTGFHRERTRHYKKYSRLSRIK